MYHITILAFPIPRCAFGRICRSISLLGYIFASIHQHHIARAE